MNFISLSRIRRFITGVDRFVSSPSQAFNQLFQAGNAQWERIVGEEAEIFDTTGILQVILNKKASMKSVGIWRHQKMLPDGTWEDLKKTAMIDFMNKPNVLQSKDEYLKEFSLHRDIFGGAFVYKLMGSALAETPLALWNIVPYEMTIKTSGLIYEQSDINEIIKEYVYNEAGSAKKVYKADEILLRKLYNAKNPILLVSPFLGLNMEISNIRGAMGYRNVILRKKGAIGILSNRSKDSQGGIPLSEPERKRIEKQYQKDHGIGDEQMQIIITNADLNWQPTNYPTNELMLFEEITEDMKRIIDRYGLNDKLFSAEQGSTLSDSGSKMLEAQRMVYQDTIIPESEDDAKAFSDYLGLTEKGERLILDYSHIQALKDDEVKASQVTERQARAFAILAGMETGGFSRDEAAEMVGLTQPEK